MEEPFGQVSQTVQKILGLEQHVDSLERMNREMAQEAEAFQASLPPPPAEEEGEIFVQTADGKGVPIRRPGTRRRSRTISTAAARNRSGRRWPRWERSTASTA
jgi:hypothetical protein